MVNLADADKILAVEYLEKVVGIISKERSLTRLAFGLESAFWSEKSAIHLDVYGKHLLERWNISFTPNEAEDIPETKANNTSLVLMVQSLYAKVRNYPVGNWISSEQSRKSKIACSVYQGQNKDALVTDFHNEADLVPKKLTSAAIASGTITISLVYDSKLSGLDTTVEIVISPPRKASSPFPSPTMQKKLVSMSQNAFLSPESHSKRPPIYSPKKPLSRLSQTSTTLHPIDTQNTFSHIRSPAALHILETKTGRRDSITSVSSELFGSLVGSYEESIMSGRMSTHPSKPITFLLEIGVIGFGKCKSHLKCPPHAQYPFKAYFYTLENSSSPSTPYVGTVDMSSSLSMDGPLSANSTISSVDMGDTAGYRVPLKGQLQLVI